MSWLIAVLVLASVSAAVAGDRLGHRLGKKRVSLFSLRPRHSGVLATSVLGGVIALVLSPIALWGAGFFSDPDEPVFVTVPVARRAPDRALAQTAIAPASAVPVAAVPAAAVPSPSLIPMVPAAASPVAEVGQLKNQLGVATREIGALRQALAAKPQPVRVAAASAPLIARQGELLCSAQVPGGLGTQAAQQALHDVLSLVERYGQRRGAGSGLAVAGSQVAELTSRLQTVGAFVVHVQAGRTTHRGEPLQVQLSLQALPPGSLADLQERDRVEHSASSQTTVDQALAQVPGGDGMPDLPAQAYVPLADALKNQDHRTRLVWRGEPVSGGPLLVRVSPDTANR